MNTVNFKVSFLLSISFVILVFYSIGKKSNDVSAKQNYQLYTTLNNDKVLTNYSSSKCKDCHKDGISANNLIELPKNKCGYKLDLFIQ
jgi:hypothetical protein